MTKKIRRGSIRKIQIAGGIKSVRVLETGPTILDIPAIMVCDDTVPKGKRIGAAFWASPNQFVD